MAVDNLDGLEVFKLRPILFSLSCAIITHFFWFFHRSQVDGRSIKVNIAQPKV